MSLLVFMLVMGAGTPEAGPMLLKMKVLLLLLVLLCNLCVLLSCGDLGEVGWEAQPGLLSLGGLNTADGHLEPLPAVAFLRTEFVTQLALVAQTAVRLFLFFGAEGARSFATLDVLGGDVFRRDGWYFACMLLIH